MSLSALGAKVYFSKGHLSKIENGATRASLALARACDTALGTGGRLAAAFLTESACPALAADPCGSSGSRGSGGSPRSPRREIPFDIPAVPSHFTGREETAARLIGALGAAAPGRAPVVLIHGMPGIGKTALAIHAAHTLRERYPGGCLFAEFGGRPAPDAPPHVPHVPHASLLRRLGIAAAGIPDDPGEARELYLSAVCRRPVLIVADDVTSAAQVSALRPASAACGVIATSRRDLDALDDCHRIRLGPLAAGDAIALFSAVSGFPAVSGQPEPVSGADLARIALACGGVPLAIRVAAAALSCLAECGEILSGLGLPLNVATMLNCMGEAHSAMAQRSAPELNKSARIPRTYSSILARIGHEDPRPEDAY